MNDIAIPIWVFRFDVSLIVLSTLLIVASTYHYLLYSYKKHNYDFDKSFPDYLCDLRYHRHGALWSLIGALAVVLIGVIVSFLNIF
jgi:hypothetical protein